MEKYNEEEKKEKKEVERKEKQKGGRERRRGAGGGGEKEAHSSIRLHLILCILPNAVYFAPSLTLSTLLPQQAYHALPTFLT